MKKCIILANGQAPGRSQLNYLKTSGYQTFICADGGANTAFKLGITPNFIIGDFDSVRKDVLKYYKEKSQIINIKSQYTTDVEKCLNFAVKNKYTHTVLLGATGDRLDHSFCNLGIVLKYFGKIKIYMLHQKSVLAAFSGKVVLNTELSEIISIYGIDGKTKFTTYGLKYPLNDEPLPFGVRESTSNIATREKVVIEIKGGKAFIIRNFKELKKNGFFQLS